MTRQQIERIVLDKAGGDEILLADGFDDAFLGVQQTFEHGGIHYRALY